MNQIEQQDKFNFQSNHTGIETTLKSFQVLSAFSFQSNHTGIETQQSRLQAHKKKRFQSNHTGIETCLKEGKGKGMFSSNRTILELKHFFALDAGAQQHLPIEPYWN